MGHNHDGDLGSMALVSVVGVLNASSLGQLSLVKSSFCFVLFCFPCNSQCAPQVRVLYIVEMINWVRGPPECLWWYDYCRNDFPTLKFGVVLANLPAICRERSPLH